MILEVFVVMFLFLVCPALATSPCVLAALSSSSLHARVGAESMMLRTPPWDASPPRRTVLGNPWKLHDPLGSFLARITCSTGISPLARRREPRPGGAAPHAKGARGKCSAP